jgi:hypothetical protein
MLAFAIQTHLGSTYWQNLIIMKVRQELRQLLLTGVLDIAIKLF